MDALEELNKGFAKVFSEMMHKSAKEKVLNDMCLALEADGKNPHLLVKNRFGRYRTYLLIHKYTNYLPPRTRKWTDMYGKKGSTKLPGQIDLLGQTYNEGQVKVISNKVWKKIKAINDEIDALQTKKHNILKANYSKMPKLTLRRLRDAWKLKIEMMKKVGLAKEDI